jgi:hypothetical protein
MKTLAITLGMVSAGVATMAYLLAKISELGFVWTTI